MGMKYKISESAALSFSLRTLRVIFSAPFAVKNKEEKKIKTRFTQFYAVLRNFTTHTLINSYCANLSCL
jgi:hypothetical protein